MSQHIYNVTVVVDTSIEEKWKQWIVKEHITEVMDTGMFRSYLFTQVFPEQEQDNPSYSIQYRSADLESIKLYMQIYVPELRKKSENAWGTHALAFRTILEVIDEK